MSEESRKEIAISKGAPGTLPAAFRPFQEWERMFDELVDRGWMRGFPWNRPFGLPTLLSLPSSIDGTLKVDIIDRDGEIAVRAELPGIEKDDVSVTLSDNVMTIKAEAKCGANDEEGDYHCAEIYRGALQRALTLPFAVDETKARASMKDGILEVVVPKVEQTRRTSVKIA